MSSVFNLILQRKIPGHFVFEDENVFAIMTINPIAKGHVLVIPTQEVDEWTNVDESTRQELFTVAHRIAEAQKKLFPCERVALIIAGFEVPHCHLHLIPATSMRDVSFSNAAATVDHDELAEYAAGISRLL
ncbi:MAG: HIT family protein [Ilumatobacteraceae bacterium]|nr:HIT family protein [Ilumatobacteraceae bacterium]